MLVILFGAETRDRIFGHACSCKSHTRTDTASIFVKNQNACRFKSLSQLQKGRHQRLPQLTLKIRDRFLADFGATPQVFLLPIQKRPGCSTLGGRNYYVHNVAFDVVKVDMQTTQGYVVNVVGDVPDVIVSLIP